MSTDEFSCGLFHRVLMRVDAKQKIPHESFCLNFTALEKDVVLNHSNSSSAPIIYL